MQSRTLVSRAAATAGAVFLLAATACTGSVGVEDGPPEAPRPPGRAPSGMTEPGPTPGPAPGPGTSGPAGPMPPPPAASCSGRSGRPAWKLSPHTTFQVETIVAQVFGAEAAADAQVRSLLENLPETFKAKGFDTEEKAVAAQFVDGYVALVGRLAALAADRAPVRTALETFAGKPCNATLDLDAGCGLDFARRLATALERQPLAGPDWDALLGVYKAAKDKYQGPRAYAAFVASLLLSSKSALRFDTAELEGTGTVDAHALGARLASTLTSGLPDAMLRARIEDGSIAKPEVLRAEARRLMRTPNGRATLAHFAEQWLNLSLVKSPPGAAGYVATAEDSALVARAAREEIGRLFVSTALDKGGRLADLYATDDVVPAHDWLAKLYGTAKGVQPVRAAAPGRKGLLTRVGFSLHGDFADILPLAHRGYGVKVTMLCGVVPALPDSVDTTLPPNAPPAMSSRQYFETLTERGSCLGCHAAMNPYGYALSSFSVTGALLTKERVKNRVTDQTVEVDVKAAVSVKLDGTERMVGGAGELSEVIGRSPQAQACFAHRFDQFAVGAPEPFLCDDGTAQAPPDGRSLEDTLLAYVGSAAFAAR